MQQGREARAEEMIARDAGGLGAEVWMSGNFYTEDGPREPPRHPGVRRVFVCSLGWLRRKKITYSRYLRS